MMDHQARQPLEVDVWVATVTPELEAMWEGVLPADLLSTFSSRGAVERRREIVRQALRRSVIAERLGTAVADLVLAYEPGKPIAAPSGLRVSAAHHDDLTAFAITNGGEGLGIDIEPLHEPDWEAALSVVLNDEEQRELAAIDGERRSAAYFTCWTLKEAVMKALGEGLSDRDMRTIEVSLPPSPPRLKALNGSKPDAGWVLCSKILDAHVCSLAVRGAGEISARFRDWPLDFHGATD